MDCYQAWLIIKHFFRIATHTFSSDINWYCIPIHEALCLPYAQQLSVNILTKKFFCHKQLSWEIFKVYVRQGSKVNLKCLDYECVHIDGHFWIKSVDNLLLCDWLCVDYIVKETTFYKLCVFYCLWNTSGRLIFHQLSNWIEYNNMKWNDVTVYLCIIVKFFQDILYSFLETYSRWFLFELHLRL